MITNPATAAWRRQLSEAIQRPAQLLERLQLPPSLLPDAMAADKLFRLRVPEAFVRRMRVGDPDDPLLRQVLPLGAELRRVPGFDEDPLQETVRGGTPGVIEKYHGRSLLITTGACAVNCRYCFRRHFPYHQERGEDGRWSAALRHLAADETVSEVILSGGDPLVLDDGRLAELADRLQNIPHLKRLRIHTRLPVVIPDRVDDALQRWIAESRLKTVMVLHANHPNELDTEVQGAAERLLAAGATLLNQSVLLAGVNDDAGTLSALSERLFDAGVLPYYLHLLDPVSGAAHFDVSEHRARRLVAEMAARLPGYLTPKLVREEPGEPSKTLIAPDSQESEEFGQNAAVTGIF